jgi:hypothetical protein
LARHSDSLRVMVGGITYDLEGFSAFNSHMALSFQSIF